MLGKKFYGMVMLSMALASGKIVDDKIVGIKAPLVSASGLPKASEPLNK